VNRWRERLRRFIYPFEFHSRVGVPTVRSVPVRRAASVHRDRRAPGWLVPLLIGLLGAAAVLLFWDGPQPQARDPEAQPPGQLDQAELGGGRQLAGRACVVLASDVSGSMEQYADVREAALQQLTRFSRRALRPDDVVLVVTYDGGMAVALPPTAVRDLPGGEVPEPMSGADGTALLPVVEGISSLLAPRHCAATGLASVTDGELQDDAAPLAQALDAAAVRHVHFLVPGGEGRPGPTGSPLLADVRVLHFQPGDATQIGLDYGQLIAELTGQKLQGS
jgi:hypothetical protein